MISSMPPKRSATEGDVAHVRRHWRAVEAAERRRRAGLSPLAWDNVILAYSGKKLNLKPPQPIVYPAEGSDEWRIFRELAVGPRTRHQLKRRTGLDNLAVNAAIGALRELGWYVQNDGERRFWLLPIAHLSHGHRRRAA